MATHDLSFTCNGDMCKPSTITEQVTDGDTLNLNNNTGGNLTLTFTNSPFQSGDKTIHIPVGGTKQETIELSGTGTFEYTCSSTTCTQSPSFTQPVIQVSE